MSHLDSSLGFGFELLLVEIQQLRVKVGRLGQLPAQDFLQLVFTEVCKICIIQGPAITVYQMEGDLGLDRGLGDASAAQVFFCWNMWNMMDNLFQVLDVVTDQHVVGSTRVSNVESYCNVDGTIWTWEEKQGKDICLWPFIAKDSDMWTRGAHLSNNRIKQSKVLMLMLVLLTLATLGNRVDTGWFMFTVNAAPATVFKW